MKILIVEDNEDLSRNIKAFLTTQGYICENAYNYEEARMKVLFYEYDCILLDISLPDQTGLNLLHDMAVHKKPHGIIIISAKDSLDDRVQGIQMGADDYLVKPFDLVELSVRIFSLIRRTQYNGQNTIDYKNINIDTLTRKVFYRNIEIPKLSLKEYNLLLFFLASPNKVLTKETIAEHLYGDNADMFDNFNCVYAHVKKLKLKLRAIGADSYIRSVYGVGYKFDD